MISQKDIDAITKQLKAALLNKEIKAEMKLDSPALKELQEAMEYLSACLGETNGFLRELCAGNLNIEPPGRHNFISGHLKELHSILKHLTWQTSQIAAGDYSQKVRFLGEFSDSFNLMVRQLQEREISLTNKSQALTKTMNLLRTVLDAQRDWVLVIDNDTQGVIYANLSAKHKFFDPAKGVAACYDYTLLMGQLSESKVLPEEQLYTCRERNMQLLVKSYPIEWDERQAHVHYIVDITDEREEIEQLQDLAYRDDLTDAYNRRYCIERIEKMLRKDMFFSLVLLDLDGLKKVNDTMGHNYGDDYIITVVNVINSFCRSDDMLCRIGGDEFVLIMPGCAEENATRKMKRVVGHLEQVEKDYPVQLSYGVLYVAEDCTAAPEDLISLADMRMYSMKQAHRKQK